MRDNHPPPKGGTRPALSHRWGGGYEVGTVLARDSPLTKRGRWSCVDYREAETGSHFGGWRVDRDALTVASTLNDINPLYPALYARMKGFMPCKCASN